MCLPWHAIFPVYSFPIQLVDRRTEPAALAKTNLCGIRLSILVLLIAVSTPVQVL